MEQHQVAGDSTNFSKLPSSLTYQVSSTRMPKPFQGNRGGFNGRLSRSAGRYRVVFARNQGFSAFSPKPCLNCEYSLVQAWVLADGFMPTWLHRVRRLVLCGIHAEFQLRNNFIIDLDHACMPFRPQVRVFQRYLVRVKCKNNTTGRMGRYRIQSCGKSVMASSGLPLLWALRRRGQWRKSYLRCLQRQLQPAKFDLTLHRQ